MKSRHVMYFGVWVIYMLTLSSSYAITETAGGFYGIYAHSGLQEVYGQYVNSESYSRLDSLEEYDPGSLEYFWDWHLKSEVQVTNLQGVVAASSQTPNGIAAWMQNGQVDLNLNDTVEAIAWTSTQSVCSPDLSTTVDLEFYYGLTEGVELYFGVWVDGIIDYVLLDEIDGWNRSYLNYQGQGCEVLKYTGPTQGDVPTYWSLGLESGREYMFFTYMEAQIIPEPTTLLLLGSGVLLILRKK